MPTVYIDNAALDPDRGSLSNPLSIPDAKFPKSIQVVLLQLQKIALSSSCLNDFKKSAGSSRSLHSKDVWSELRHIFTNDHISIYFPVI